MENPARFTDRYAAFSKLIDRDLLKALLVQPSFSLPGSPSQDTLELVRTSAVLYFRPVIRIIQGSASAFADSYNQRLAQASASPAPTDAASAFSSYLFQT